MERRVLIVEDDEKLRALIARVVRIGGWTPLTAANGERACALLDLEVSPHVIVLDLLMPLMNGWQFRARQLANPHWAPIPVVVLSGAHHGERAMQVAAVIPKSFTFDQLLLTLPGVTTDDHIRP
jgi:CheY-like chemotaxis protein